MRLVNPVEYGTLVEFHVTFRRGSTELHRISFCPEENLELAAAQTDYCSIAGAI